MILAKEDVSPARLAAEAADLAARFDVDDVAELRHFPKYFQVETTRLCNARCPFCPSDVWDKKTPYMSDALFAKIADEIISYRDWVKFVDLQRAGEPLLDTKIYDRVAYMKSGGVRFVAITTNASALNETNARKLLDAGIDEVMLSIDSVDRDEYHKLRIGLKYDQVLANIRDFFRLRDEIKPACIIRVRGVSFFDTTKEDEVAKIHAWEAYWNELRRPHDRIYMKRAHTWGNQKIVEGHSPTYDWVWHPCVIPFSTGHITAMGHMALCGQDYDATISFGDVNVNTIAEIWRGEKIDEMRRRHLEGRRNEVALCQGCRLFDEEFSLEKDKDVWDGGAVPRKKKKDVDLVLAGISSPAVPLV